MGVLEMWMNMKSSASTQHLSPDDAQAKLCELANKTQGNLQGYDCPLCLNRGYSLVYEDGFRRSIPCSCMTVRRNRERIERSGLKDMLTRYTFDRWQTSEPWQEKLLAAAREYAQSPEGWFVVTGRPGTGKTHICTAICGELLEHGYDTCYLLWREAATKVKAAANDVELYQQLLEPYKRMRVLYIDDLFKGGATPTAADVNLAFELINHRYNDSRLITIISSEMSIPAISKIDEAVASRIYERSQGYYFDLTNKPNWRYA